MLNSNVRRSIFFIASPFFVFPAIFFGIYKKSNFNLGLLTVIFGLLSYLYIPNISNDRARYFEIYQTFNNFSFGDFILYLGDGRADFILHLLIFVCNKIEVSIQILLFFVTSFTVGVWFYLFKEIATKNQLTNRKYFICFLLVLFSFSLPDLFSGIRFYFASAFVMLGYYRGLFEGKQIKGSLLLLLGIFIHFSAGLFLILYLLLVLFPANYKTYRYIFVISFVFLILPKTFVLSLVEMVSFSGGYNRKVELYLHGDDFIEGGLAGGSSNYVFVYLFSILWSFFAYVYLLLTIRRESIIRNIMYLCFGAINLFYVVPTIYARYLIVLKFVFVLLIIYELVNFKISKPVLITLILLSVSILSNVIVLREIIISSYLKADIFTFPTILLREVTPRDFLH